MSLIKKMRKQVAVWWPAAGVDEFGVKAFGEPVAIKCRWEDRAGEFADARGFMMASNATVYVDRPMKIGDKLKLGGLDSDTPENPLEDRTAFEIQAFESVPNLKAKEFLYISHL
jgi:hypothetical protein